jgi:hypothetical protein
LINIEKEVLSNGSTKFTMTKDTEKSIDLNKYVEFVNVTTSKPSKEHTPFIDRLMELREE